MPRSTNRTGNPIQLLQLMWAPNTKVGRTGTTVSSLTQVAIDLADTNGLDALTMRAVASQVGIGAMTLYGYVPGKAELIELMLDQLAATTYAGYDLPAAKQGWSQSLRHIAERNYTHTLAHAWAANVAPTRPILGPGNCLKYEAELAPLDNIGLDEHEMEHVLTTVLGMTSAAARWQVGLEQVRTDSQLTDQQWWALSQPVLGAAMEDMDLPISSRVGQATASAGNPYASLQAGLGLLIDGLSHRLKVNVTTKDTKHLGAGLDHTT